MSFDVWLALVALFGVGGLTPGPAVMLIMSSAFQYGFKPAMRAAFGIASANVIWLLLAARGAATLAVQFPTLFFALKIIGLLVIIYLAITIMFGPLPESLTHLKTEQSHVCSSPRLFLKGVALQLSSPMPLLFFGVLLPTYFNASEPIIPQFTIMLVTVTITELLGLGLYAYGARSIRNWLRNPKMAKAFNIMIGIIMLISGFWAIMTTHSF